MTARAPGVASRGADAPTRTTWTRDGVGAILIVLALGLAFRLIIAHANPGTGLSFDLASFRSWSDNLAHQGLYGFYERPFFHDYTPGYLYVLWLVGVADSFVRPIAQGLAGTPFIGGADWPFVRSILAGDLIKLPAILADVALGWLVWSMAKELGASRRAALIGAAVVVANPVSWFDSVIWGQVDSFGVVFLLLGIRALWRNQPEQAAVWTVIAALIKPQLGILIPIVAIVTIRRALWPAPKVVADAAGAERIAATATDAPATGWRDRRVRILTTGIAALATTFILCAPFGLSVVAVDANGLHSGLVEQVFKTAGGYPYVSVNAYNPWALAELDGSGIAKNSGWICDVVIPNPVPRGPQCPEAFQIGAIPAILIGTPLLLLAFVAVCVVVFLRPDRLTILVGVTILAIAFFILPTRVHERYLYPFFALGAILAAVSWRWKIAYVVFGAATFLNMYVVLTTLYTSNPGVVDWLGIGSWIRSSDGVTTIALANLAAALWAFAQLREGAFTRLRVDFARSAAGEPEEPADWRGRESLRGPAGGEGPYEPGAWNAPGGAVTGPPAAGWSPPRSSPRSAAASAAAQSISVSASAEPAMPTWSERPSFAEVGLLEWLRARIFDRPIRADRSHDLHGESGGRLDRLDLWFLVVLVVAVLGLRIFRLAEPYQMHFDEVYHARTATEFLQDWRYGLTHDIYEYTHPHLAKYAMAVGIVAWGDDRVSATSSLGVAVRDAIVEPRRDDASLPGGRGGDRVHVVTGTELRSYDLETRELVYSAPIGGAAALAMGSDPDRLFIGTSNGEILTLDLASLDSIRNLSTTELVTGPQAFGRIDGSIRQLYASNDGQSLLVATDDNRLVTLDAASAEQLGSIDLEGIAGFAPGGSGPAVTALPGSVEDPAAAAAVLADLLGGDAATYETRLNSEADPAIIAGIGGIDDRANIQAAIDDGRLTGLTIEDVPRVAVATAEGVAFVAPATGEVVSTTRLTGGARGIALETGVDDPKLYVTTGDAGDGSGPKVARIVVGGTSAKDGPVTQRSIPMPGLGTRVAYDDATQMIHVLGEAPDGAGPTVYVIETHANAVFADARLPIEPTAWAIDTARPYPTDDREQILVFDGAGTVASVELGKHAFAWRLPGVIAGALMAGLLYLLARILFRRREVGVLVGIVAIADGMLFVQSRIGMNDAYVGLGIVAAYTLFAAIWTGAWRWRGAFWVAMPAIGVCLGFALASKWVALYAIGALGLLILARSALGRFILIAGLIGVTAVLGNLALAVGEGGGVGNLPFVTIMIALTAVAVAVNILHPIAWSDDEVRFAVGAPAALGALVALVAIALKKADANVVLGPVAGTPLQMAGGLLLLALVAYVAFVVAGKMGFGPLAPPRDPTDPAALLPPPAPPPAESWLRPGALLGLPIIWMVVGLLVIPVALYIVSYIPWALVEGHRITQNWPPGHQGQTLAELTQAMYDYHNNLTQGHAASSPWWAWPFDLKPVWFYQEGLAGSTTAAIYDAGNLAIWWIGIPALAFVSWQAYARRSLGLALIAIGFACQWVSWARIDRAAFQYHYYTSLPFVIMAVAYFAAELWHGTSRRIWLFARVGAALAILGPALFWLFDRPLCAFVGVDRVISNSHACPPIVPNLVLTFQTLAMGVVVCIAVIATVAFMIQLASDTPVDGESGDLRRLLPLGIIAAVALGGAIIARQLPDTPILALPSVPVEPIVVVLGLPLALLAAFVVTARDARRFVIGLVTTFVGWFLVVYPNISALPLPTVIANMYQGVLPTYLYDFQFPSNRLAAPPATKLLDTPALMIAAALAFFCVILAYAAWVWRISIAERAADETDTPDNLAPGLPGG